MNQISILLFILLYMDVSLASQDCRLECSQSEGDCMPLGIRGRFSALHLNEILNSAGTATPLPWRLSQCMRRISVENTRISSAGEDCIENMASTPGYPTKHGSRSIIRGELHAAVTDEAGEITVRFQRPNFPNFSYIVGGQVHSGGDVELISQVPDAGGTGYPRLLIQTTRTCFSID